MRYKGTGHRDRKEEIIIIAVFIPLPLARRFLA